MNEVLQTIQKRYSCRSFEDRGVEQEKLEAIALAAVQAPSAMNQQPWEIIVIKNKDLIDEMDRAVMEMLSKQEDKAMYERILSRGGKLFYNAPSMFIVAKRDNKDLDCGIVTENIALAATSLGLGNVICGMMRLVFQTSKSEYYKEKLFPNGYEFGMSVLVGYASGEGTPHQIDTSKIKYID